MLPVTLYIPAYNAAAFLDRVLAAVMAQTHPLVEILVIDDGSTDATAAVAGRYATGQPYPLRVLSQPRNRGLAVARNTAVRACTTPYIAALDSDVMPAPDWLANLAAEMTGAVAAVGGALYEHYQETVPDRWRTVHMVQHRGARRVWRPPFIWGCNTLWRREVLLGAGLYPEYCRTNAEDVKLCEAIRDREVLVYTHLAVCEHLRRDTLPSLRRNFWKWYYYGCYSRPHFAGTLRSNWRHVRRLGGILRRDVRDRDAALFAVSLSMIPYTLVMDWLDLWRRREASRAGESG